MLTAQEIANYLVQNLDTIGATRPELYEFSILAEIAKGYDGKKINGMVRTVSADPAPIPSGYFEAKYVFVVEMFVSGPTNKRYLNINSIINEFITANQGSTVAFENGNGVVTFTMGVPKGYKIEYGVGEGVPLTFTVYVTYTENAVTSGDKHWFLDGVEIPYINESVAVEREGISRKIYTEIYSKVLVTGQTKFYTFTIPYESNTFKTLQSEILQAPAVNEVVHTLTYYDGAAFTKDKPYISKVTIYRSANSASERPNASAYTVTFSDVYDPAGKALKYEIALIDFPFDMQSDDTRFFDSTAEQMAWFEDKATKSSAPFIEIQVPNLDGLVITKQVYRAPNASAMSQFDYISKNYAVIKVTPTDKQPYYFYYFIQNSTIGADGCIMVDLKMDTVQTYFFREDVSFSDCLIERAHLNRFVPVEGDPTRVKFVTDPASKIYNAEQGLNFPKRLVQRDKLKLRFVGSGRGASATSEKIDNWLNENVAYWVYIFIDPTKDYETNSGNLSDNEKKMGRNSFFDANNPFVGATNIISYPIYKQAIYSHTLSECFNTIIFNSDFVVGFKGREGFEEHNNGTSYYYTIKLSCLPPFNTHNIIITIDKNNNLVLHGADAGNIKAVIISATNKSEGEDTFSLVGGIKTSDMYGLFFGSHQDTNFTQAQSFLKSFEFSLSENELILKSEIINSQAPNLKYNPKLNSQNFKELVITASNGDTFAYDIQKLNDCSITFEYSEPIQPEITKYYMRVQGGTGQYAEGTDENYMGLVGSTDTSLMYALKNYDQFLANNKNFFLQSNMGIALGAGPGIADTVGKALAGDYLGAATSALSTAKDIAVSVIDRDMTLDNMKSAPDQLKNANGNVIFNLFCTELGLYVEKYSASEGDLKTANDFMNIYGFSFSGIANVKDYANIRKYHNYVKAQLQSINGNLSNMARADLRQRFANGVRFWNGDKVSYEHENYESWLESDKERFELWSKSINIPLGN